MGSEEEEKVRSSQSSLLLRPSEAFTAALLMESDVSRGFLGRVG
jgi:hypothetical protein